MVSASASRLVRVACSAILALAAVTADAATTYKLNMPVQNLEGALVAFAEATGVQLLYSSQLTKGLKNAPLNGEYEPEAALRMLLAGTGLSFRFTSDKTVTLSRASQEKGTRVLDPVRVEGAEQLRPQRGEGVSQLGGVRGRQDDEARGYRPVVATAGTGTPTAIEDIPRSVSVLTQEQMELQDITDIGEALKRMPGLSIIETSDNVSAGATIVSRGFRLTSAQVDGDLSRSLNVIDNGMLDIGPYERIELVRGPNGAFVGTGSPGGTINLVRKRPGTEDEITVTAVGGSWNRRQLGVDYSTPSIAGSPLAFRGVATYQDQEFFYKNSDRRNWLVYGIVDAPLGDNARLEFGVQHSDIDENGSYNGIGRYADGALLPFPYDYNLTPETAYTKAKSSEVFSKFIMDLPALWKFELGASYRDQEVASVQYIGSSALLQATNAVRPGFNSNIQLREKHAFGKNLGVTLRLAGRAHTFGIDHNLLFSSELDQSLSPSGSVDSEIVTQKRVRTLADLDPTGFPEFVYMAPSYTMSGVTNTRGIVVGDTLSWRDWVDVNVSARRSESNTKNVQVVREADPSNPNYGRVVRLDYSPSRADATERKPQWRPNWSVTLKPTKQLSVYGSRSSGMNLQDAFYSMDGESLGPLSYESDEVGVKYGTHNWLATVAAYQAVRTNVAVTIPGTNGLCPPNPSSLCYRTLGDSLKSSGVDVELTGEIVAGLSVAASYNYNKTEKIRGVTDNGAEIITQAPAEQARLMLDWRLPFLQRTSMNIGAVYGSSVYQAGPRSFYDPVTGRPIPPSITYEFSEPSHVVVDVGVRHQFDNNLSLSLLVENVSDKRYLSTVSSGSNFYGRPRAFTATVVWKPVADWLSSGTGPTTGSVPFGDASRWYGALEFGGHDAATFTGTSSGVKVDGTSAAWDFEIEPAELAFARLGYRLSSHWRVEAEGGLRGASFGKISGGGTAPNGVCDPSGSLGGRAFKCDDSLGEMDAWSVMFNGLYDFRAATARVRPYVGLGVGVSRWSIDFGGKLKGTGLDAPWTTIGPNARSSYESIASETQLVTWGWQAMAGATIRLTDRAQVTAGYTFFNVPDMKFESYNMPTLTPTLGTFRGNYQDHAFTLGVRWFFARPASDGS